MDLSELTWSYDFGASSVMVSHIRKLESLGYFAEGSAHEPREETVSEVKPNKAIVFEDFLPRDCVCHLILLSLRFCSNSESRCIN
jgi:hypothetical protein